MQNHQDRLKSIAVVFNQLKMVIAYEISSFNWMKNVFQE